MRVADLVDAQVTGPSVGDHGGPWGDVVGDERVQRAGRPIGNDAHPTSPKTLWRPYFHGYCDQRLLALGPAAGQPGLLATDVGLVDLHPPRKEDCARPLLPRQQPGRAVAHRLAPGG